MNWEHRRMLELAGLKRRRTPDNLLREGDEGGDDLFGDDSGGDDEGGDDLFGGGDDDAGGDDAGDDAGGGEEADDGPGSNRETPEELEARDVEKFGSPRFLDLENKLQKMFNDAWASGSAAAQNLEVYPGNAIDEEPPTPAKDDSPPESDDEPEEDDAGDEGKDGEGKDEDKDEKEDEDKNESFYRYGNRRDKWLITEAMRLLNEAESEGSAADEFDMERFCTELANYLDTIHNTEDIEGAIFNSARQMILNNFGKQTEGEFVDMLAAVTDNKWDFLGTHGDVDQVPLAVGASAAAAGG